MMKPEWWTSDHWSTPPDLMKALESKYGPFDLDPCCRAETAKAPRFYTIDDNGLTKPWFGRVYMNPPFSKPGPWLQKAIAEIDAGRAEIVVALLPVSTDTRWFHNFVKGQARIEFIEGRVKFLGWMGTPIADPKRPNMLAIYGAGQPA